MAGKLYIVEMCIRDRLSTVFVWLLLLVIFRGEKENGKKASLEEIAKVIGEVKAHTVKKG